MKIASDQVWVTGMGCVSPAGKTLASSMQGLMRGVRPQAKPNFMSGLDAVNPACMVCAEWMPETGRALSGHSTEATFNLALLAAEEAMTQAGIEDSCLSLGVSVGTTAGNALHFLDGYAKYHAGENPSAEDLPDVRVFFTKSLAAGLQRKYGGKGPVLNISNACTSGTDAIGCGMQWLNLGLCDYVLAGGADALSVIPYVGFDRLMIYSAEPCKPFDKRRAGLNLGEGAGMLLLERASHAKKRKAAPLAFIAGYGAACDAYHFTAPHPHGRGLERAITAALAKSGVKADELAFVNAHGTATKENDKTESRVFGEILPETPIWASKGSTGHCLGAAGAIEAAFSISALVSKVVPPSTGCEDPEEDVSGVMVRSALTIDKKYALSVSLGFGGGNSAIIVGRPE